MYLSSILPVVGIYLCIYKCIYLSIYISMYMFIYLFLSTPDYFHSHYPLTHLANRSPAPPPRSLHRDDGAHVGAVEPRAPLPQPARPLHQLHLRGRQPRAHVAPGWEPRPVFPAVHSRGEADVAGFFVLWLVVFFGFCFMFFSLLLFLSIFISFFFFSLFLSLK